MADLFDRQLSLTVTGPIQPTLDLSQFRVKFEIKQSDFQTPNEAIIRVYNLKKDTIASLQNEYTGVTLKAGYQDPTTFGLIFTGTIKQTRAGKERNVDSFIDISASDGDLELLDGFMNVSTDKGLPSDEEWANIVAAMGLKLGYTMNIPPSVSARGKVKFGMARDFARQFAETYNARWSVQNGSVNLIPLNGYLPGQAVKLNSDTGLIGVPEVTDGGVRVTSLLNPNIVCGGLLQINNQDILGGFLSGPLLRLPGNKINQLPGFLPIIPPGDGFYKVLVAEHHGDTRGHDWYTEVICISVSIASPPADSIAQAG